MSKQKTIELSPDGKCSIEIIDERHMIIKCKTLILNGKTISLDQQS
ncbi:hypothetical protein [Weissella hellenica]